MRAPVAPRPLQLGLFMLLFGLASANGMGAWLFRGEAADWALRAAHAALSVGAFLGVLLGIPLVKALGLDREDGPVGWGRWVAYHACFFVGAALASGLRAAWVWAQGLGPPDVLAQSLLALGSLPWVPLIAFVFEREAALRQAYVREGLALDAALGHSLCTQAELLALLDRKRAGLLAELHDGLLPAIRQALADALTCQAGPRSAWGPFAQALGRLGEDVARGHSHRLHPAELLRFGLGPALRTLGEKLQAQGRGQLWVDPSCFAPEWLKVDAQRGEYSLHLQRLTEGLLARWVAEAPAGARAWASIAQGPGPRTALSLSAEGAWPWTDAPWEAPEWALLRARLAVLGGHFEAESDNWGGRISLLWPTGPTAAGATEAAPPRAA